MKQPISIITDDAIVDYTKRCNEGTDSYDIASKKIRRMCDLGEVVYFYNDVEDNQHYIVRYFDMNVEVLHTIVLRVWRDTFNKKVRVSRKLYNKYNSKHGLVSSRDV